MEIATYQKRTNMVLVFLAIIAWVAAAPDKIAEYSTTTEGISTLAIKDSNLVCESPECAQTALSILNRMDSSVNPCDNFYQFACGKFVEKAVIPDGSSSVSTISEVEDILNEQLRRSLQDGNKDGLPAIELAKSFYSICMSTDVVEKNSDKDLQDILNSLGGWPVLEGQNWNENNFDWKKAAYAFRKMGLKDNLFVSMNANVDQDNSSRLVLAIDQATINILPEFVVNGLNEEFIQSYLKFMTDAAEFLGKDLDKEQTKRELRESLSFEIELANISLPQDQRRDRSKLNNRMTLQQLEANFTGIPWREYIREILGPNAHIAESDEIVVNAPSFIEKLPELIARTPKRVLANYALWRAVHQLIGYMGDRASSIEAEFDKSVRGIEKSPRWKKCIKVTIEFLGIAVGRLYVDRYFDASAKDDAISIIGYVRFSLYQMIQKADWMDEATKLEALKKFHSIKQYVAYPDELVNDEKINEYHKDVKLDPESFIKSVLNVKKSEREQEFLSLRKSYDEVKWALHSSVVPTVNAFFDIGGNTISIEAAILQGHFFNPFRPNYMNYGAIGWVIGHEMTHAFDDQGSQYDMNGNLVNWWQQETREKYLEKANCTIERANNFVVKGIDTKLNGVNMQGENIADHGGLKAAYYAYKEFLNKSGVQEPRLPGLHYTPEQLFWISAANVWCEKVTPEQLKKDAETNVHAPGEFRVIDPMSNIPDFSKDFKCSPGSRMNPLEKCSVW